MIVRENLDGELLASVRAISGKDFRFVPAGQRAEAQVGVLLLGFSDEPSAASAAQRLALRGGHFQNTVILTPFAYRRSGDQMVVAFTENAGNAEVVQLVRALPQRLYPASSRNR